MQKSLSMALLGIICILPLMFHRVESVIKCFECKQAPNAFCPTSPAFIKDCDKDLCFKQISTDKKGFKTIIHGCASDPLFKKLKEKGAKCVVHKNGMQVHFCDTDKCNGAEKIMGKSLSFVFAMLLMVILAPKAF